MRIKILACLALAVCIFAVPVSAKDKNKTADMFLNGWGTVAVPDNLYIQSGTQQLLIAREAENDMTSYIARSLPGVTPHTYQLVKSYKGEFQYAYMMHYSLLASDVKTLMGTDSVTPTAMNAALTGRLPRNFYVAENMHGVKVNGNTYYIGTVNGDLFVNNGRFTEAVRILVAPRSSGADVILIFGQNEDSEDLLSTVTDILVRTKNTRK